MRGNCANRAKIVQLVTCANHANLATIVPCVSRAPLYPVAIFSKIVKINKTNKKQKT